MSAMNRCTRCEGFVPPKVTTCPNCRSTKRAWWIAPAAIAGAGLASVTLSACYGVGCATRVTLPDGGFTFGYAGGQLACDSEYDCRTPLPDGGKFEDNALWKRLCEPPPPYDAGTDNSDGGSDGGTDGGH